MLRLSLFWFVVCAPLQGRWPQCMLCNVIKKKTVKINQTKHLVSVVFWHVSVLCLHSPGPSSDHWAVARLGVAGHPCCTRKVHDVNLNKRPRQSVRIFPLRCEVHVRWRWDVQLVTRKYMKILEPPKRVLHQNCCYPKRVGSFFGLLTFGSPWFQKCLHAGNLLVAATKVFIGNGHGQNMDKTLPYFIGSYGCYCWHLHSLHSPCLLGS